MSAKRRCRAMLSDGSRQCRNAPIMGGTVCRFHGAGAPQVRASARERLEALVDPAITGLRAALDSEDVGAILKAARLVLDRTGYPPVTKLEMEAHHRQLGESQGRMIVRVLEESLGEFGIDAQDPEVRKVVGEQLRLAAAEEEGEMPKPPGRPRPKPKNERKMLR